MSRKLHVAILPVVPSFPPLPCLSSLRGAREDSVQEVFDAGAGQSLAHNHNKGDDIADANHPFFPGKMHGQGTLRDLGRSIYTGGMASGEKSGLGSIIHKRPIQYKGGYKDGKMHGLGCLKVSFATSTLRCLLPASLRLNFARPILYSLLSPRLLMRKEHFLFASAGKKDAQ